MSGVRRVISSAVRASTYQASAETGCQAEDKNVARPLVNSCSASGVLDQKCGDASQCCHEAAEGRQRQAEERHSTVGACGNATEGGHKSWRGPLRTFGAGVVVSRYLQPALGAEPITHREDAELRALSKKQPGGAEDVNKKNAAQRTQRYRRTLTCRRSSSRSACDGRPCQFVQLIRRRRRPHPMAA
jgi:hypothetical protein